jgi:hypothetical protein
MLPSMSWHCQRKFESGGWRRECSVADFGFAGVGDGNYSWFQPELLMKGPGQQRVQESQTWNCYFASIAETVQGCCCYHLLALTLEGRSSGLKGSWSCLVQQIWAENWQAAVAAAAAAAAAAVAAA